MFRKFPFSFAMFLIACALLLSTCIAEEVTAPELDDARDHLQHGRYAEALESLDELKANKKFELPVAIVRSRVFNMQGKYQQAITLLQAISKQHPQQAMLSALLAEKYFQVGQYEQAEKFANAAVTLDEDQPLAHLVLADVYTETGRLKQAHDGYRWFIRYYNRKQPKDAETLVLVGRASAQYARWNSSSQIFDFVINTLYVDALDNDESSWRAHYYSGLLLLEKFNRAQSIPDFNKALAINPQASAVLVALGEAAAQKHQWEEAEEFADRALKANPNFIAALQLKAMSKYAAANITAALQLAKRAQAINPRQQTTLAILAACYYFEDGPPAEESLKLVLSQLEHIKTVKLKQPGRMLKLIIQVASQNAHPGYFMNDIGALLESRMQFDFAETFYKQAIKTMPRLPAPQTALGMLYMRVGKTKAARKMLNDAFKADPYHVRVSNMRKVLRVLEGYDVIATDHFVVRVDSRKDRLLGKYMSDYLEEIYPELVKKFGFEPPERTQFEIYNESKGISAHQWFSARMVGLPWIQTIGASTGKIVALASPTAAPEPYNWARVLKHEYVHIITLQQTKFNIPHWFTEALAVTSEGYPPPEEWNQLLLKRVANKELWTLKNLNNGFIRPKVPEDWTFAYCQSRLYALYMTETYGADKIPKMLAAYTAGKKTKVAIEDVFEMSIEDFEKGYLDYINKTVATIQGEKLTPIKSLAELKKRHAADADDLEISEQLAYQLLQSQSRTAARKLAQTVITQDPTRPYAALVLATLDIAGANTEQAIQTMEHAINKEQPNKLLLTLLTKTLLAEKQTDKAQALLELGLKKFPLDNSWTTKLVAIYTKQQANDKLKKLLEKLIVRDADNALYRKKLARMAFDAGEFDAAVKYAKLTLHIDVLDAGTHLILGACLLEKKEIKSAIEELTVALELSPGDSEIQLTLAKARIANSEPDKARVILQQLLISDLENSAARELLDSID